MRYRRAIAFLRKRPELLDDAFVMPLSEAERLLQADPPPTFAEMIARAKEQHPECPPERWAAYDRILARQTAVAESAEGVAVADAAAREHGQATAGVAPESGRPVVVDAHGSDRTTAAVAEDAAVLEGAPESGRPVVAAARERRSAGPRRWRPVRTAAGVVAAAALFLALVPAGRTFAHDVLHYLVGVFGNTVTIARQEPTATATAQAEAILYDDLASFTADTGLVPFVLDADWLEVASVYGRYTPKHGCFLWIVYTSEENSEIHTRQSWFNDLQVHFQSKSETFVPHDIRDGLTIYISESHGLSCYDSFIDLGDSFLLLGIDKESDLNKIIDLLQ